MESLLNLPGYKITQTGKVWSDKTNRFLTPQKDKNGYLRVWLCNNGKQFFRSVHQLVLETFIGPKLPGMVSHHKDNNRENNNVDNLCWTSQKYNIGESVKSKKHRCMNQRGSKNALSKLTEQDVRMILYIHETRLFTHTEIANMYNITCSAITKIVNKQRWKHIWRPS